MILSTLFLQNFRNFKKKNFEFSPQVSVIVGPNTSGKTNILEAIYMLATGRSFRAEVEKEVIAWGEEIARLGAEVTYGQNKARIPHFRGDVRPQLSSQTNDDSSLTLRKTARTSTEKKRACDSGFSEHSEMGIARLIRDEQNETQLEIVITTGQVADRKAPKKQFLVNGVKKRLTDFLGNFFAVLFSPQDLQLITDSPSLRRKYLNDVLSVVSQEYRRALLVYEKALRQRNRLLERIREGQASSSQLDYWDKLLIDNGKVITEKRGEFIDFINSRVRAPNKQYSVCHPELDSGSIEIPKPVSPGASQGGRVRNDNESASSVTEVFCGFKLGYEKNEISQERLEEKKDKEILLGMTLVGPHRDDFIVTLHVTGYKLQDARRDLSVYGSRGEQRLAVLWLKLCELAFLEEKTGQKPVLLLDDIFSELDQEYRELVTRIIPNQQTIITTTEREVIKGDFLKEVKTIKLGL